MMRMVAMVAMVLLLLFAHERLLVVQHPFVVKNVGGEQGIRRQGTVDGAQARPRNSVRTGVGNGIGTAARTDAVAHHDAGGAIEAVLEIVADHPEVGQAHPARLHRAGAGHTMTFAFLAHLRLHMLRIRRAYFQCDLMFNFNKIL